MKISFFGHFFEEKMSLQVLKNAKKCRFLTEKVEFLFIILILDTYLHVFASLFFLIFKFFLPPVGGIFCFLGLGGEVQRYAGAQQPRECITETTRILQNVRKSSVMKRINKEIILIDYKNPISLDISLLIARIPRYSLCGD